MISKPLIKIITVSFAALLTTSCVTETVESPAMKFDGAAVISVGDPNVSVAPGSTFAWLSEAVRFYDDERLDSAPLKSLIESEIVNNIKQKQMVFVDSVNGATYEIAYTAALESSLDDSVIIRRFGLLPGMSQTPKDDANVEKGSLIVYVFEKKSGSIIWRSAAQVSVAFDMPMDKRKERVIRVVAEMFQTFPVQAESSVKDNGSKVGGNK